MQIRPVHIIGLVLRLFFITIGLYLLLGPHILGNWPIDTQRVIGGLLVGYGIFRAWMSVRQIQRENKIPASDE